MSKCSEKNGPVFAAGRIVVHGLPAAWRKILGAGSPKTERIVRENRPLTNFEFFRAGSKPAIAPGASAQIRQVWNGENAKSCEKFATRSETSGCIKFDALPPRNSAGLLAAESVVDVWSAGCLGSSEASPQPLAAGGSLRSTPATPHVGLTPRRSPFAAKTALRAAVKSLEFRRLRLDPVRGDLR